MATDGRAGADEAPPLTILDVGHGNAAVLRGPLGVVLIDAGPRNVVLEWFRDQEIARIDCVVITHADDDHLRGLVALLDDDSIEIEEVCYNGNAAQTSAVWDAVLFAVQDRHLRGDMAVSPAVVTGDELFAVGGGLTARAVAPSVRLQRHGVGWRDEDGHRACTNTLSIVIHVRLDGEESPCLPTIWMRWA